MTNINDFVYFGTVRKYPYPSFDLDVVQDVLANPGFQGNAGTSTRFAIENPLLVPEQVVGTNVTKDYYFTVFARSTITGEYMRRSGVVFYDALPRLFIDGFSTPTDEHTVHVDLRIDHLYPHYMYEYAGRVSEVPLTDIVITDLFDNQESNIEGIFVQSQTSTVAKTKPDINQDPQGALFYVHMFTRPIADPDLVSLVAETRIMQVIENNRFTVKEIDADYEPSFVSGTLGLAENKTDRRIDVSLTMNNIDDSYTYFGVVNKYPYEEYTVSVVQEILTNPSFQGTLDTTTHFFINT